MEEDMPPGRMPRPSTQQMLEFILTRLERFPAEGLVRMEAELQNLRRFLEEESASRKGLGDELHGFIREMQETIDKRMDRALTDCRQDRDLRLTHLSDQLDTIRVRDQQERTLSARMKIAVFGAIAAFVISIVNAAIHLLFRK